MKAENLQGIFPKTTKLRCTFFKIANFVDGDRNIIPHNFSVSTKQKY